MDDNATTLMFLSAKKFENNKAVRGAFLLTDAETKPLEFRCTDAIRPTQLQTVLYGDILDEYILVELVGKPLVDCVRAKPAIVIVNDPKMLKLRSKIDLPVILVTKEEDLNIAAGSEQKFKMINSSTGKFSPVVIAPHDDFLQDRETASRVFSSILEHHDIREPFDRVSTALEQVHALKVGENPQ